MKFLSEQPEELSRRAHCEDELRKNTGTTNSPGPSKENHDNPFLGSTATTFMQQFLTEQEYTWKKIRQMLGRDNRIKVLMPRDAREVSMPPEKTCYPSSFTFVEKNVRHERFGQEVWSNTRMSRCATIGSHHQASHSVTCRDRMRAELEKSEEGR